MSDALGRGRPLTTHAEYVRDLAPEDLGRIGTGVALPQPTIQKMRASHHTAARCIAMGMRNQEAAHASGYNVGTINFLMGDPAFQDLIAQYRKEVSAETLGKLPKLNAVLDDLMEEYHERLQKDPESFTPELLESGMKTFLDRTGHGPQSKSTVVNVNIDLAERMKAARERVRTVKVEEIL